MSKIPNRIAINLFNLFIDYSYSAEIKEFLNQNQRMFIYGSF